MSTTIDSTGTESTVVIPGGTVITPGFGDVDQAEEVTVNIGYNQLITKGDCYSIGSTSPSTSYESTKYVTQKDLSDFGLRLKTNIINYPSNRLVAYKNVELNKVTCNIKLLAYPGNFDDWDGSSTGNYYVWNVEGIRNTSANLSGIQCRIGVDCNDPSLLGYRKIKFNNKIIRNLIYLVYRGYCSISPTRDGISEYGNTYHYRGISLIRLINLSNLSSNTTISKLRNLITPSIANALWEPDKTSSSIPTYESFYVSGKYSDVGARSITNNKFEGLPIFSLNNSEYEDWIIRYNYYLDIYTNLSTTYADGKMYAYTDADDNAYYGTRLASLSPDSGSYTITDSSSSVKINLSLGSLDPNEL